MAATDKQKQAARDRLTRLSSTYEQAEAAFQDARDRLNKAIVDILTAQTLGPSEVTRHVPYERQHVGRVAKAGGVPPLRAATVSKRATTEEDSSA